MQPDTQSFVSCISFISSWSLFWVFLVGLFVCFLNLCSLLRLQHWNIHVKELCSHGSGEEDDKGEKFLPCAIIQHLGNNQHAIICPPCKQIAHTSPKEMKGKEFPQGVFLGRWEPLSFLRFVFPQSSQCSDSSKFTIPALPCSYLAEKLLLTSISKIFPWVVSGME